MNNNEITEKLNDLLTKAYDAEQGFNKAAERVDKHPSLARFFKNQSDMRLSFGHDIKQAIAKYGGEPDKGSSVAGKAHQIWITLKDSLSSDYDEEAVLEECIRGEKAALEEYDEKLACAELPADVREMISNQRNGIANSLVSVMQKESLA